MSINPKDPEVCLDFFMFGPPKKIIHGISTVPWACVSHKYKWNVNLHSLLIFFYADFLYSFEGSSHEEVVLKIGAVKV